MAQVSEITQQSQVETVLRDGVEALGLKQQVTFQEYSRIVLPLDGYVFWQPQGTVTVTGSLHYSQHFEQNEDETAGVAEVIFTSEAKVAAFSDAGDTLYVSTIGDFRFAFAQQGGYYSSANLWHYSGKSVYPALASQLLDSPSVIDTSRAVASNSLPLWLALAAYKPVYGFKPAITLYPASIVAPNLTPPYGAVLIDGPDPLTAIPALDGNSSSTQPVADRVKLVLYGLQSNEAIDFLNSIIQYSRDTQNFGLMSMPRLADGRRTQTELQAIAMQKTIDIRVSYTQSRVNTVAQKLILSALPTVLIQS